VGGDALIVLARADQVLDVADDLDDVLLDTGDGVELVLDAVETDARDRRARDGRQQRATQRVAERVAEAGLEGLDDERGAELRDDLFGEGGTLCNEHVVSFRREGQPYEEHGRSGGGLGRRYCRVMEKRDASGRPERRGSRSPG